MAVRSQPPKQQLRPQVIQNQVTSRTLRNRRRRQNQKANRGLTPISSPSGVVQNYLQPQALGISTGRSNMVQRSNAGVRKALNTRGISKAGMDFLKCAFAAPDFDGSSVYGVPDDYGGKSLAIKHRAVVSETYLQNLDVYYILAPIPGIAYYRVTTAAGVPLASTATLNAIPYSNFSNIFPNTPQGNSVTSKFRMVSSHFEIVPTTNNNNWTGNIQAFKVPLQMFENTNTTNSLLYWSVSGLQGANATDADMYSGPFNLGIYTGSFNKGAKFDFQEVLRDQNNLPSAVLALNGDFGQFVGQIPGFDNNFETTIIKVSGIGANVNDTALIKTWSCVEYQFVPGNIMYESQLLHAGQDDIALAIYKQLVVQLPLGVSFLDNANFWQRVLKLISQMGGALSILPGPYGAVAGGVGAISTGLEQLIF